MQNPIPILRKEHRPGTRFNKTFRVSKAFLSPQMIIFVKVSKFVVLIFSNLDRSSVHYNWPVARKSPSTRSRWNLSIFVRNKLSNSLHICNQFASLNKTFVVIDYYQVKYGISCTVIGIRLQASNFSVRCANFDIEFLINVNTQFLFSILTTQTHALVCKCKILISVEEKKCNCFKALVLHI